MIKDLYKYYAYSALNNCLFFLPVVYVFFRGIFALTSPVFGYYLGSKGFTLSMLGLSSILGFGLGGLLFWYHQILLPKYHS